MFMPNRSSAAEGKRLFEKMDSIVQHFLQIPLRYVGSVSDDPYMNVCWRRSAPILSAAPHSLVAQDIAHIASALLKVPALTEADGQIRFFR